MSQRDCNWGTRFFHQRYGLPVVIVENGLSNIDWVSLDGKVHDPQRIDFFARYLRELRRAADEGIPVEGYFQWTLMDNFEWASGYRERFCLIHVDFGTQKRLLKDSALWYGQIISSNGNNLQEEQISGKLQVRFGHVAITVSDLNRSLEFYSVLLGCEVWGQLVLRDGAYQIVYLRSGPANLVPFRIDEKGNRRPENIPDEDIGYKQMCFQVHDADAFAAHLKSHGVKFLVETVSPHRHPSVVFSAPPEAVATPGR